MPDTYFFKIYKYFFQVINQAESSVHDTESKMTEYASQLPADQVEDIKKKITEVGHSTYPDCCIFEKRTTCT